MYESISIAALRRRITVIERQHIARPDDRFVFGVDAIDDKLGEGLGRGHLHEVFAATPEDGASAAGFALMMAMRATPDARPLLWLRQLDGERQAGQLHAPGLAELGLDPATLVLAIADDTKTLLKAAGDSVRSAGLGAVIIEPRNAAKAIDLTVSRRLTLAAEQSGVTVLLLRTDSQAAPSTAQTRWEVRAALSEALNANAPGAPAFEIRLLRQRGGRDGLGWHVEWNRDQRTFREAALPSAVLPLPFGRSVSKDDYIAPRIATG